MYADRLKRGVVLVVPVYRHQENMLGFETDLITLDGIPASNVYMEKVPNTRKTDEYVEVLIERRWAEISKNPNAKDNPRARFEGSFYDNDTGMLHIRWSDDRYKNHATLRETRLPKPYQAALFTINGIPHTKDEKIPIVVRNPKTTDQGRIRHIAPAGFIDVEEVDEKLRAENVSDATVRKLFDELGYSASSYSESPHHATGRELFEELQYGEKEYEKGEPTFPPEVFNPKDMRVLGIVYNSLKNFDYTASVLIPLSADSNRVHLKGGEHEEIEWVGTNYEGLRELLLDLSISPETNSGHLRGNVALTIGHLHGETAYTEALEYVTLEIAKRR